MLITRQIEHKYEKGKAKRGRGEGKRVHRKREYIVQKKRSEDGRGQKGRRAANMKRSRRGRNQKKGRDKKREKRSQIEDVQYCIAGKKKKQEVRK
jgi:hypothetical protein